MGEIGLIASLQDGEATKQLESLLEYDKSIELHPLQFREITAKILYKTILMNRTPSYMMALDNGILETFMMPLQGLSSKPIFDEWDNDFYAKLLSEITKVPLKICNPEKGKCWTWLIDINNKPIFIDINKGNE